MQSEQAPGWAEGLCWAVLGWVPAPGVPASWGQDFEQAWFPTLSPAGGGLTFSFCTMRGLPDCSLCPLPTMTFCDSSVSGIARLSVGLSPGPAEEPQE